jgi:tetratricopeptide (TPR) repeat protein
MTQAHDIHQRLAHCEAALRRNPHDLVAWHDRGGFLFALERWPDALASYEKVIALDPRLPEPHDNRGLVLQRLGRHAEAIEAHAAAIARNPGFGIAYVRRAMALREFGRFDEAHVDAERGVSLMPGVPIALNARGITFSDLGRMEDAVADFRQAISAAPQFAEAINNLGNTLHDMGSFEEAIACFDEALRLRPGYPDALSNRGLSRHELGRLDTAMSDFDAALAARPGFAEARKRRAALHLLRGDYAAGWRDYGASLQALDARERANAHAHDIPVWQGESLAGKSLLLSEPNGFGDALQYWRFIPRLLAMGATLAFQGRPELFELLRSSGWPVRFVAAGEELPGFDLRCQLWSVPRLLGMGIADIPADVPYLFADPARVARWSRLCAPGRLNIGICWQGKPGRKIDAGRSIPLAAFAPLAGIPGVRLVSLQRGHGVEQLRGLPTGIRVVEPDPTFDGGADAFLDTAALIQSLDLVVTSDTAVAHLAGALGRPAWLALKWMPEWRWMQERTDSPWYPTMRLFRQSTRGDWPGVFAAIAHQVRGLASETPHR